MVGEAEIVLYVLTLDSLFIWKYPMSVDCSVDYDFLTYAKVIPLLILFPQTRMVNIGCYMTL